MPDHPLPDEGSRPLAGIRVVEFHAKGPVPFCTMLLAQMGARVAQILRAGEPARVGPSLRYTDEGKEAITANLKSADDQQRVAARIDAADVVVEGFRPGVMERLGLGPDACLARNPGLIYVRITGWGQHGERAGLAGHDINYLAATGALDAIGTVAAGPVPPLNLLADFAGGSLFAAMGVCAALHERNRTGRGRIIDAAMTDGVLSLMTSLWAIRARGDWTGRRGENFLDGGAPYYAVYRTADDRYLAVGAMERPFREAFFRVLGLPEERAAASERRSNWAAIKSEVATMIASRTQDDWRRAFAGVDACVTPVATLAEALADPELRARGALIERHGHWLPGPAPRFGAAPSA